jgi:predicted Rossmann fold nucleotide-binding protein DprA/Smf involved in DNA uptake
MSIDAGKPLDILRERRGPVPDALRNRVREHGRIEKALTDALAAGPRSAPEIAADTGLPTHQVFWHLMAMRKYGRVAETEEAGGYCQYSLVEKGKQ